jgi:hypothetical protein
MTEAREQSFAQYLAAKKAVVAYGRSEKLEDEQSLEMAPTSSASRVGNVIPLNPSNERFHMVRVGTGKTYILTYLRASTRIDRTLNILSKALITSETLKPQFTIGEGDTMATQQPSTVDEQSVEHIIWHVRTTLPVTYRLRLASRLSELQKAVQEEELDGRGISVGSMQHFVEFLEHYPALRCPAISVTPDRNIYASWKSGPDRVFSIHFLSDGGIRFVIFRPNHKHPGQTIRLSGTATVDVVMSITAPHGVLDWASE